MHCMHSASALRHAKYASQTNDRQYSNHRSRQHQHMLYASSTDFTPSMLVLMLFRPQRHIFNHSALRNCLGSLQHNSTGTDTNRHKCSQTLSACRWLVSAAAASHLHKQQLQHHQQLTSVLHQPQGCSTATQPNQSCVDPAHRVCHKAVPCCSLCHCPG